jgi:hypothetical protein
LKVREIDYPDHAEKIGVRNKVRSMREHQATDAQPPSSGKRLLFYSLILLTAIVVTQVLFTAIQPAHCLYKYIIYEPQYIPEGAIPLPPQGDKRPRYLDFTYMLEAGNRYHVFLVGDWITNSSLATDYDIWVYNKNGLLSRHTESAGRPEQVGNDAKNQYFVPSETGDYTFRIINDLEDSDDDKSAVFMVIQHIEMNRRYSLELIGKYNSDDEYTSKAYHAFEFDTASQNFELFVNVPDSDPSKNYLGLDMYEARVYPMANPAAQVGYYIRGIGVPTGEMLTYMYDLIVPTGSYGGYNYIYEKGFRFPEWTASCERNGYDMRVTFGAPLHNETELVLEDRTVFYYLVLMAEYDQGTIQFYLKTDANNPTVTLVDPGVLGYTDDRTKIEASVNSNNPLDSVWVNYTTDDWATQSRVDMVKDGDVHRGYIPKQTLNKVVKYRVYAMDEIENQGSASGSFEVKERVTPELTVDRISLYGGESIAFFGSSNVANKNHVLRIQGATNKDITVATDTAGAFEYTYKPPVTGSYTATLVYVGDPIYHPAYSLAQEFTVAKRELTVTCSMSPLPAKQTRPLTITGSVSPPMSGVPVNIVIVSPEESFVESVTTSAAGTFSTSITPNITGSWEMLPQVLSTAYNSPSQGDLISFQVVPLSIPEIIMYKAAEFTQPPLVLVPAGLVVAAVAGVEVKTGIIRGALGNGKGKVKAKEATADVKEPHEEDEGTSGYKRRSSRESNKGVA